MSTRVYRGIGLWGLAFLAAAGVVLADPAPEASPACQVASPQQARSLADRLFEQGDYRRAGACYQAAGDLRHADLAFVKAVGPESEDTARALKAQRDAAKSLFESVGRAFRNSH